jgi:hypothetical protein
MNDESGKIYLYAIIDRPTTELPRTEGIEGACAHLVVSGAIAAVVSPVRTMRLAPAPENLWRHEAVIEALMQERAVLPARFGSVAPNEDAVCAALATHHDAFVDNLRFVAGRVEVGLRVLWADEGREAEEVEQMLKHNASTPLPPYPPTSGIGRSYILARLAEERATQERRALAKDRAAALHSPLEQLAIACTQRVLATPRLLLTAAYLIEREQIDEFKAEVTRLSLAHPDLRLLSSGPWPPYHFVTAGREQVSG